jgi:hypothetical protein
MKKYIRDMIDDLKIPAVPKDAAKESVKDLTPPPEKVDPLDLSDQVLSDNSAEKVKQLDYQAFESERLQTNQ